MSAEPRITRPRIRLNADITNGPVVHDHSGRYEFRVDQLHAEWIRDDLKPWRSMGYALTGPRILKSGSESVSQRGEVFYRRKELPAWLESFIREHHPEVLYTTTNEEMRSE